MNLTESNDYSNIAIQATNDKEYMK